MLKFAEPVGPGRRRRWETGQADESKENACVHPAELPAEPESTASRAGFAASIIAERSVRLAGGMLASTTTTGHV